MDPLPDVISRDAVSAAVRDRFGVGPDRLVGASFRADEFPKAVIVPPGTPDIQGINRAVMDAAGLRRTGIKSLDVNPDAVVVVTDDGRTVSIPYDAEQTTPSRVPRWLRWLV